MEEKQLSNISGIESRSVATNLDASPAALSDTPVSGANRPDANAFSLYKFHGRLAQFRSMGEHREHWEERWSKGRIRELLADASSGKLNEFDGLFTQYLPRDLPVLEAGCGQGQLVMALDRRGYLVEGVDYAAQTIGVLNEVAPELKTRVGDVYNLDVPDGSYGGYISIGIFEHNPEGPQKGLSEVRRVLHPRGVALISVPYLNTRRQKVLDRVPVAENAKHANGLQFYQYYFAREEFERYLRESGLEVIRLWPYSLYSGLTRDFTLGGWLHDREFFNWRIHRRITRWCREVPEWVGWRWAHMLMFVCKRA